MIRINLYKKTAKKKQSGRSFPFVGIAGGVLAVAVLILGGVYLYRSLETTTTNKPTYVASEDLLPSTYKDAQTVEEVVREVREDHDKLHERGLLDLPYEELSFNEKINYEIYFARNVCELLATTVPGSVGLRIMEGRDYATVYGVGVADSKQPIASILQGLRSSGVNLLERPLTKISKQKNGYQFVFTGEPHFGLDLSAPHLLGVGDLYTREEISAIVREVERIADRTGISLHEGPTRMDVKVTGRYRRFHYT
ncbi:MAG: hypothetical protein GF344_06070, partial [Chitinivibrionales bacterium]|nr:hypothetical protein [Chitinivibrionales bacterium]MBD3356507.1 hypothetical protein [Chitinivibrionales bacterium]